MNTAKYSEENFALGYEKMKALIEACLTFGANKDGKIPKTKLAKLVYLSDFVCFYEYFHPITGVSYRKLPFGPVADEYFAGLEELENDEVIAIESADQSKLISFIESLPFEKGDLLSSQELDIVQKVCQKWKDKSTKEIVDFTHRQIPWSISFDMDIVPYVLITQEDPDNVF